jgi:hypothetical protein
LKSFYEKALAAIRLHVPLGHEDEAGFHVDQ